MTGGGDSPSEEVGCGRVSWDILAGKGAPVALLLS